MKLRRYAPGRRITVSRMLPGTRVAIEALLYTRELEIGPAAFAREPEAGGWSARLPGATLATYRRGARRPLDAPRVFFRSATTPKRWDPAEPRTKRPRPPSARSATSAPSPPPSPRAAGAATAATAATSLAKGTEITPGRPAWTAGNSPRVHARSVYACKPLLPRPAAARIFHSDDPLAGPDDARPALQLREPMGAALHGDWVGCHPGVVKHRGACGSAPGWVDYAREATCTPSRGRVRRSSTATPPVPKQRQRRGHEASSQRAKKQEQVHAVLEFDARQMRDMLVVGAEKLRSAAQAKLRIDTARERQREYKRTIRAATLIQTRWRGGRARRELDEMHWGAIIVQANFRSRKQRIAFAEMRKATFLIQKHARGRVCRQQLQRAKRSAILLQSSFRGWLVRNHFKERSLRDKQLLEVMAQVEQVAAARMQAVFRGLKGRRKARAERLRQMDYDQRLSEIERTHRAQASEVLMKQQAVRWKEQQEEEARVRAERLANAKRREAELSRVETGDTGTIVRVTTRGAPGYGTFVAAFGEHKTTDWIELSKGDWAFRR